MPKSQSSLRTNEIHESALSQSDWQALESKFQELTGTLDPFEILSPEEFTELKFSYLTFGLYKCLTTQRWDKGFCLMHAHAGDEHRRTRLKALAQELGYPDRSPAGPMAQKLSTPGQPLKIIEEGIISKTISLEFHARMGPRA